MTLKFKVGDKARAIGGYFQTEGLVGVVTTADPDSMLPYDVDFQRPGHFDDCWIFAENELEAVEG